MFGYGLLLKLEKFDLTQQSDLLELFFSLLILSGPNVRVPKWELVCCDLCMLNCLREIFWNILASQTLTYVSYAMHHKKVSSIRSLNVPSLLVSGLSLQVETGITKHPNWFFIWWSCFDPVQIQIKNQDYYTGQTCFFGYNLACLEGEKLESVNDNHSTK